MSAPVRVLVLTLGLALGTGVLPSAAHAAGAESVRPFDGELGKRANALLERAARHIEQTGEKGAADFGREAAFVDRDLYVYALRMDGQFLASGGFSAGMVGSNVLDYTDTDGKAFFREMLVKARETGQGRVEYRWYNPADSRGEPKTTLFRKVGEIVVAVGYFSPRATPVQARAMLKAAEKALRADSRAALAEFQGADGRFVRDDLYVFAVDLGSKRFIAHGASPALIGTDALALRDPDGRPIVREMLDAARNRADGELEYRWVNPVSGKTEMKHSYFREVAGTLLGVGYYRR